MLRLVIDTAELSLEDDPRIVYLGHSASKAQEAIDASPSDKLSIVEVVWLRRAKKSPGVRVAKPVQEVESAGVPSLDATGAEAFETADDGLDKLTIEKLKALGEEEGITFHGAELKQDYVDIVRLFRDLDQANNLEVIKEMAKTAEIDTKGFTRKADYLNAVVSTRRLENSPP